MWLKEPADARQAIKCGCIMNRWISVNGNWKLWRRVRTRVSKLRSLGVPTSLAITTGSSRKSYWHSSKSLGINMGLSVEWLTKQGLVSLRDQWITFHHG